MRLGSIAALLFFVAVLGACRDGPSARRLIDGGRFELPDSGVFFDARPVIGPPEAGPADTGPHVCEGGCPDGSVCGCLDREPRTCGCALPQGYNEGCDPQHPETCGFPYKCVRGRKIEGLRYICSDGREGSSCSTVDSICNTSRGCNCVLTPFGVTACSCQGEQGENPLLCNPARPETCPGGTCVRIETSGGAVHFCSQGRRYDPCVAGDSTCRTSLGCTCPYYMGRQACQCSEPGEVEGELCDPRVAESCVDPLECTVVRDEAPGSVSTQCAGRFSPDGGVDPLACDPARPFCPQGFTCVEIRPSTYRCVLD